ncbi:hypothetical protein CSC32_2167 [Pseudomonas aeruginosa]|nr:hypothetical protein CSC32_2167 [Pseudomonas aeruginosa]RCG85076.1 hypothetical protein CSB86_2562 [Pseudomonas aeruginosa]
MLYYFRTFQRKRLRSTQKSNLQFRQRISFHFQKKPEHAKE